ncbi:hypothetical protein BKA65DRAFT_472212 [Rhexocercosporidium sp. MPI-PUGE-AT-0058]|nr:hypothetical protein BKA65DRAFT_472212 [Rhexocercosporidium sp. MPI-PUGE-AT-0058]
MSPNNETNPSQLGDPISLKAETSSYNPIPESEGAASSASSSAKDDIKKTAPAPTEGDGDADGKGKKTLRQKAMHKLEENPSQLGDLVSLKAETSDSHPTENDRGAADIGGGKSKL